MYAPKLSPPFSFERVKVWVRKDRSWVKENYAEEGQDNFLLQKPRDSSKNQERVANVLEPDCRGSNPSSATRYQCGVKHAVSPLCPWVSSCLKQGENQCF